MVADGNQAGLARLLISFAKVENTEAVILSTQQPDDFQSKELVFQTTAFYMAFGCNSEQHALAMAKQMVIGRKEQTQVAQTIRKLKPFSWLQGNLLRMQKWLQYVHFIRGYN